MSPLLACTQLTQVYRVGDSEVIALQGLDLRVDEAEMLGVVGASGSGKSTLMQVLSGLLRPAGGKVLFDGMDLGTASRRELDEYRRSSVGFVRQDAADNLVPYLTALQTWRCSLSCGVSRKPEHEHTMPLSWSGSPTGPTIDRSSFRVVNSSGPRWLQRWCMDRAFCWPMNRRGHSTPRAPRRCLS